MWRTRLPSGPVITGLGLRRFAAVADASGQPTSAIWRRAGPAWLGFWLLLWALCGPISAHGQNRVVLPSATDLPQALAQALAQGQPLVVMVSLDNCPYCRQVRQSHLGPMWRGGQVVVQIDMQHKETLVDWDGQTRSHGDWVKNRRISVAPTVLFFGPDGREVADRLEGASLPDFYGAYLDQRLAQARQSLQPRSGMGAQSGVGDVLQLATAPPWGVGPQRGSAPSPGLLAWKIEGKH